MFRMDTIKTKSKRQEKKHRGVFEKEPSSGIWWVRYFDASGRKHREKVGRKSDAINLYQQRKAEIRAGAKLPANLRRKGETLATVISRALDWYASHRPKSVRMATIHLNAFKSEFGNKVAADLTPDDVDKWISSHKDWTPATMNRYKATLGKALQLAVVSGHLQRNVARLVTARREDNTRVRWLKDDEEKRIVETILKNCPEHLPSLVVALHTGMRASEQFSLEWSDVDFERRKIFLDKTKTGNDREVPMSKTCFQVLKELYDKHPKNNKWVFLSIKPKGQRILSPRQWFENVCAAAKVDNFHWHDLRHTFASRLVMRGVSLQTVSKLLGHASLTVTLRYAHLSPDHLAGAVDVLD